MAEAVVSTILEQLASVLRQQVEQEVRLVVGVDEEVNKLTSNFQAIKCVLEDAECKQVKDKAVGDWLEKLKEVSCNMEDLLDEWNTAILKRRIMEANENASKLVREGHWELDESVEEAALRESFEEAGVIGNVENEGDAEQVLQRLL